MESYLNLCVHRWMTLIVRKYQTMYRRAIQCSCFMARWNVELDMGSERVPSFISSSIQLEEWRISSQLKFGIWSSSSKTLTYIKKSHYYVYCVNVILSQSRSIKWTLWLPGVADCRKDIYFIHVMNVKILESIPEPRMRNENRET